MKKYIAIISTIFMIGCALPVDQETADRVLSDEGYSNIELEPAFFGCSEDDYYRSTFRAHRTIQLRDGRLEDRIVEGTICCGFFKDCTVRHH